MKKYIDEYGFIRGWKNICAFLGGVHINTAKNYKRKWGLPVHYFPSGRIYAIPAELIIFMDELHRLRQTRRKLKMQEKAENSAI